MAIDEAAGINGGRSVLERSGARIESIPMRTDVDRCFAFIEGRLVFCRAKSRSCACTTSNCLSVLTSRPVALRIVRGT